MTHHVEKYFRVKMKKKDQNNYRGELEVYFN